MERPDQSTITVNIRLNSTDDMSWENYGSIGMRRLTLASGAESILGRDPRLRRTVFGTTIVSRTRLPKDYTFNLHSRDLYPPGNTW